MVEPRVLDELERLQEALWASESQALALRSALRDALPLLTHTCDAPTDCRRCRALASAKAALDRVSR